MYKHNANSIKETSEKRFISQADKDKYDGYSFMRKKDTYNKEDVDKIAKILNKSEMVFESSNSNSIFCKTSKKGFINDFEVCGNTIQSSTDLSDIKHIGEKTENGYVVKVKTVGKNLFDMEAFYSQIKHVSGVSRTERGIKIDVTNDTGVCSNILDCCPIKTIPLDPNKRYVLRGVISSGGAIRARIDFSYEDGSNSSYPVQDNYFINSKLGCKISGFKLVWNTQTQGGTCTIEDVAVYEVDEEVTEFPQEYYEYEESVQEIILEEPLKKIGSLYDSVVVDNNKLKLIKKIGTKNFFEDISFYVYPSLVGNTVKCCITISVDVPHIDNYWGYQAVSNILPFSPNTTSNYDFPHILVERYGTKQYAVLFMDADIVSSYTGSTLSDKVTAYLKDVKAFVHYQLAEPEVYELDEVLGLDSYENATFLVDSSISASSLKCKFPVNIGDVVSGSNRKIEFLRNEIVNVKGNVSDNTLKKEVVLGDIYDATTGYIEDFEIKGKTVYDLAYKFNKVRVGSTISDRNVTIERTSNRCRIIANEAFSVADYATTAWAYVLFQGMTLNEIKPNTKYKVMLDFHSNYEFVSPTIAFCNFDSSIVNSIKSVKDINGNTSGRLTMILETKSELNKEGCGLFVGIDGCSFRKGQYLIIENISIIEYNENDDINISKKSEVTQGSLVSVGSDKINIINNSPNLIDFSNFVNNPNLSEMILVRDGLNVEFDSKDSCIVHNTLTNPDLVDTFFIMRPKYGPIGNILNGVEYELSWKYEVIQGELASGYAAIYLITNNIKDDITSFKAVVYANVTTTNKVTFTCNLADASDLLFRIDIDKPGLKMRFYDIKLVPKYNNIYSERETDNVSIDLTKYGIEGGLKSLPNGVCDRIYKHNGRYYLEQNVGTVVLDGSRAYSILDSNSPQRIRGWSQTDNLFKKGSRSYNSLMLYSGTTNGTITGNVPNNEGTDITHIEFLAIDHNGNTVISLSKEVVSTVEDYKNYFKNNPITVYGQLKESKIIELDEQLDLRTFEGKNTIYIENENICPVVSFNLPGSINSTIKILSDKVRKLQSNNTMMDSLTLKAIYNGDCSKFDLSIMSYTRAINEIDNDLYELFVKVINSKSCNICLLENMIDFFFMIDKLSMEMVDELFMLIEEKY